MEHATILCSGNSIQQESGAYGMDIIAGLQSKNNTEAYQLLLLLEKESEESDGLYTYFSDFLQLLKSKNAYIRTRGFRMVCAQARWDTANQLDANLCGILASLDGEKPTAVRQRLAALHQVLDCKPYLSAQIEEKIAALDLTKYKESMRPLIEKDIRELQNWGKEPSE